MSRSNKRKAVNEDVFTIGTQEHYDAGILKYGKAFKKSGPSDNYAGGYAVHTIRDAMLLTTVHPWTKPMGIYRLDAKWSVDTKPSKAGWWRGITRDVLIIERVWPLDSVPVFKTQQAANRYADLQQYWLEIQATQSGNRKT